MKNPPALRLAYTGFALIGIAVVCAFLYQHQHATPLAATAGTTTATTTAGTVPATRPAFTLTGLDGQRHPISEWDGHPQLVNFWATWCVPCRKEIPLLNRIQAEYAAKGLKIIGIAVDFPDDVRKFVQQVPLSYAVLMGEDDALEAAKSYGVEAMALPFSAFVDAQGHVLTVHLGELHEANLRATLDILYRVDAGTLALADAKTALEAAAHTPTDAASPAN
ncbi:MAG: TlpA disulfide reductase family protein [Pseudomonadota bacterium]